MKRFLSVFLSVILLVSAMTVAVTAQEKTGMSFSGDWFYRMDEAYDFAITTFEATIKLPEGYTASAGTILGSERYYNQRYDFKIAANGVPYLYVIKPDKSGDSYNFSKANIPTGEWVHIAIVRDVKDDVMKCYVNGEYKQSIKLSSSTFISNDAPYVIGGDYRWENNNYFKGEINSIKLYTDVRTAKEIKSDMYADDYDNLMAYYDLSALAGGEDEIITDKSGNGYDAHCEEVWLDEMPDVGEYDYSMIVVGDQQKLTYFAPDDLVTMYDHIIDYSSNPDNKMEYLVNLGDLTDYSTETEWDLVAESFDRLTDAGINYSFVRGNHDVTIDTYNAALPYEKYGEGIVDGTCFGDLTNYYRKIEIGGIKYMFLVLDYGANDEALEWANEVVEANPDYNVIMATHFYLTQANYDDGIVSTAKAADIYNNGQQMWDEFISKHDNISMVLGGHVGTTLVKEVHQTGNNGNDVTSLLINPQDFDYDLLYSQGGEHGSGMIVHFFFSDGGKTVKVRQYSTIFGRWFRSESQFTVNVDVVDDNYLTGADFIN